MENNFSLAQTLANRLLSKNLILAVAESCTGGGLAYQLTQVTGSSNWFDRGFITYSDLAKVQMLKVDLSAIEQYGAVSEQTALQMAKGALSQSEANVAISITGIAGPEGGTLAKPVGTVWFGLAKSSTALLSKHAFLTGGRHQVRHDSITIALHWLLEEVSTI